MLKNLTVRKNLTVIFFAKKNNTGSYGLKISSKVWDEIGEAKNIEKNPQKSVSFLFF